MLTVPGLRRAFTFGHITIVDAAVAVIAAALGVTWFEIRKMVLTDR
jgi:hypothetical protein